MSQTLRELVRDRRVIVCVGSGGVGKTTIAASIALHAAMEGRRALVVTIDPARRLANSMGLANLGNVESRIGPERFAREGLEPKGELYALMLDVKRTCDEMISRHATSKEQADKIFKNRFYQTTSTVLAGSHEYMAMEKLYELHDGGQFDLLVLDTPPTTSALDFLDAPNRLTDAFGNDALKWIATPAVAAGKVSMKAFGLGGGYLARQISKFTGVETLSGVAEFLLSMRGMYDGFKERAAHVKALLSSSETSFVLITSPNQMTIDEARFFYRVLRQNEAPVGAVVVNRVRPNWPAAVGKPLDLPHLSASFEANLAERLVLTVEEQVSLARADGDQIALLRDSVEEQTLVCLVPVLSVDIHDLRGLQRVARYLFDQTGDIPRSALPSLGTGPS